MKIFYFFIILIFFLTIESNAQWVPSNDLIHGDVSSFNETGEFLFAGLQNGGVRRSTNNGANWNIVHVGMTDASVMSLAVIGTNLFAGTHSGGGVFLTTNYGTNWTPVNAGLASPFIQTLVVSGINLFAGTYNGGVFLSTNNGTNWTQVNNGLTNLNVYCLAVSDTNIFAGTNGGGIFHSTNNGANWTQVNSGLSDSIVFSLIINETNLFAGTFERGVFLSTNYGTSWTQVNSGLTNLNVQGFAASGTNLFMGTFGGGVFLSTNNGESWVSVNNGLPNPFVRCLFVREPYVYAGTIGSGVWRRPLEEIVPVELISFIASVTGNSVLLNWATATEINNIGFEIERAVSSEPALPSGRYGVGRWERIGFVEGSGTTTEPKSYSYTDNNVISGTYRYRLKQIDFDGTFEYSNEIEVDVDFTPQEFTLYQNYPNPFNPITTIKYALPSAGSVKIVIYNMLGETISEHDNSLQEAGYHSVEWNAGNSASGIYFYSINAKSLDGKNDFSSVKKMMLVK